MESYDLKENDNWFCKKYCQYVCQLVLQFKVDYQLQKNISQH